MNKQLFGQCPSTSGADGWPQQLRDRPARPQPRWPSARPAVLAPGGDAPAPRAIRPPGPRPQPRPGLARPSARDPSKFPPPLSPSSIAVGRDFRGSLPAAFPVLSLRLHVWPETGIGTSVACWCRRVCRFYLRRAFAQPVYELLKVSCILACVVVLQQTLLLDPIFFITRQIRQKSYCGPPRIRSTMIE